jgi:hypothetical protein
MVGRDGIQFFRMMPSNRRATPVALRTYIGTMMFDNEESAC